MGNRRLREGGQRCSKYEVVRFQGSASLEEKLGLYEGTADKKRRNVRACEVERNRGTARVIVGCTSFGLRCVDLMNLMNTSINMYL